MVSSSNESILGPISITKTDKDGRVIDQIQANYTNPDWAMATITPNLFTSWTAYKYANTRLALTAVYHDIDPNWIGLRNTNGAFLGTAADNYALTTVDYKNYGHNTPGSDFYKRLREQKVLEKVADQSKLNVVLGEKSVAERVVNLL